MYLSLNLEHGDFIILIAYFLLFPLELRHTSNFALGCDFQFQTRLWKGVIYDDLRDFFFHSSSKYCASKVYKI